MNTIPLLEYADINIAAMYLPAHDCDKDIFEQLTHKYPFKILDIFEECMKKDDENIALLDLGYFRLANERKYLDFIHGCFLQNESKCYVQTHIDFKECNDLIYYMERLDTVDKHLIMNQLQFLKKQDSFTAEKTYLIKDLKLVEMFLKGFLREIFHGFLFFDKKPMAIFSNFDMSLPIVFFDSECDKLYAEIAMQSKLFVRN